MDRRDWWVTVLGVAKELDMTEQLQFRSFFLSQLLGSGCFLSQKKDEADNPVDCEVRVYSTRMHILYRH